ncbi:MAG: 50S ribosomal protein L3 [Holosporaceae bacterium]|jgi:large subunit ribosomal protein L3|nr:50S ribosomal protein L3 [Holosporaceae bacterium]
MRTGILGKKVGMTRVFAPDGQKYALTVLQVSSHCVLAQKTQEKHGYNAIVVGTVEVDENRVNKPMLGYFKKLNQKCYKILKEFRGSPKDFPAVGTFYGSEVFQVGQRVDVSGVSIGKGFAGGIKRHNFGGLRASHGVSVSHRSHGSIGNREYPGKVFKGKRMAGHLGNVNVTIQNLSIYGVDGDLLLICGGVPGSKGRVVVVRDAVKRKSRQ